MVCHVPSSLGESSTLTSPDDLWFSVLSHTSPSLLLIDMDGHVNSRCAKCRFIAFERIHE